MSFCPAYWDWHDQQFDNGNLASIDLVLDELKKGNDELSDWGQNRVGNFLPVDDENTQKLASEIANFVMQHNVWKEPHVGNFLSGADLWLIAKAKSLGATVVTHELPVDNNSTKVKIPNVCSEFDVPYINTYELLEALQAQFILG